MSRPKGDVVDEEPGLRLRFAASQLSMHVRGRPGVVLAVVSAVRRAFRFAAHMCHGA